MCFLFTFKDIFEISFKMCTKNSKSNGKNDIATKNFCKIF